MMLLQRLVPKSLEFVTVFLPKLFCPLHSLWLVFLASHSSLHHLFKITRLSHGFSQLQFWSFHPKNNI